MNAATPPSDDRSTPRSGSRSLLFYVALVVLACIALCEIILPHVIAGDHAHHFWFESLPAWGSLYGFVSCIAIIVVSKFLGKVWLTRREDYWREEQAPGSRPQTPG